MDKSQLWPREGKGWKGLIILAIVIVSSLALVLIEEKTTIKFSKRMPLVIAFLCIAVWLYNPQGKKKNTTE